RSLDGTGGQSGQDSCDQSKGGRSESGLSRLHVPLGPGPMGSRPALLERVSVEEIGAAGAGQTAGDDRRRPVLSARAAPHHPDQSTTEGLGELLLLRVSTNGVSEDQQLRAGAVGATTPPSQSAALPSATGDDLLCL